VLPDSAPDTNSLNANAGHPAKDRPAMAQRIDSMSIPKLNQLANTVMNHLLARALIAAYRDRSYKHFITLARLAARLAEWRATYG
jgi:hypothetical protein